MACDAAEATCVGCNCLSFSVSQPRGTVVDANPSLSSQCLSVKTLTLLPNPLFTLRCSGPTGSYLMLRVMRIVVT